MNGVYCSTCHDIKVGTFPHKAGTLSDVDKDATCCDYPLHLFLSNEILQDLFDEEVQALVKKNPTLIIGGKLR